MPEALPHQIEGSRFLAARDTALLADEPRVGKTGAAIMGADDILAARILVVTTASGRAVWAYALREWMQFPRSVVALHGGELKDAHREAGVLIIGWAALDKVLAAGLTFDLLILDESHYAKNVDTKRTKACFGTFSGTERRPGLRDQAAKVWCLTGTPIPNAPNDLFPMMRALCPERLTTTHGPTDVSSYETFLERYCVVRKKRISRWNSIDVVVAGRNLPELHDRLEGFMLRRTQKDVGIMEPIYDVLPLHVSDRARKALEDEIPEAEEILMAAETGETKSIEMHLGSLRRVTGGIKAKLLVDVVAEEVENGIGKVVLMCWHRDVMDVLQEGLWRLRPARVDGTTSPAGRDKAMSRFATDPDCKVFLGQVVAAGEAIDLSAAAELIFVEGSMVPKDMKQAALRITNHNQTQRPRVRVAALEGSIDEAIQAMLVRKVRTIKGVIE